MENDQYQRWSAGFHRTKKNFMEQIANIERAGLLTRTFFWIGEGMFGQVPTPERLMAHRLPLVLGLGGLYGAIEWFGKIDAQLRALLNVQVASSTAFPTEWTSATPSA